MITMMVAMVMMMNMVLLRRADDDDADGDNDDGPKSAPSVNSGGAGHPFPGGWLEESKAKCTPNRPHVLRRGWLEKARPKSMPNRPQVLRIAVKSLIQVVPGTRPPRAGSKKEGHKPRQIGPKCCV
jgi:hypothetical protein